MGVIGVLMWWGQWEKVAAGVEAVGWPVRWGVGQVAGSAWQVADGVRFIKSGVKRIEDLERENARLSVETEELVRLRQENQELRRLRGLSEEDKIDYVAIGRVVGQVEDEIVIDQGQDRGVKVGMVAVTADKILAGRVVAVGKWMSRVRLVSALDEEVAVTASNAAGRAVGAGGDKLWLDQVLQGVALETGAAVVSSGSDGVYPGGWLVGRVGEVVTGSGEVYQRGEIKRAFGGRYGVMVVIGE